MYGYGGQPSSLQPWQYNARLATDGQFADAGHQASSVYADMNHENGLVHYSPMQPPMNSDYEFTARQLPAPGAGPRLPSMVSHDGMVAVPQGASYRPWPPSWTPAPVDGFTPSPSRASYTSEVYEDAARMPSMAYGSSMSPPYLLPSIAPVPRSAVQTDGGYGQLSRPYMPLQPGPYGYGMYQAAEHESSRYASMTMS